MLTKKLFSLTFILFTFFIGSTQITCTIKDSISFKGKNYQKYKGKDLHDNFFFLEKETLIKTNNEQTWEYANLALGVPTSVSLINPLQVLIFYKEANSFVLLDRFLSEVKQVDLNTLDPIRVAKWVKNTKNKEVWIYNSLNNELEFFNYKNNTRLTENTIINGEPIDLAAGFNSAYLLFENKISGYNNYGTLINSLDITGVNKINLNNNILVADLGLSLIHI